MRIRCLATFAAANSLLAVAAVAVAAMVLVGCGAPGDPTLRPAGRVHIVLYVIDTLRRDRLGFYGYERDTSPFLDALAGESVVFDAAYAPAPWTLPSMVSLMTSRYPVDHQVLHGGQKLVDGFATLPVRLQALGFRTGGFVMNPFAGDYAGLRRGYDHYEVTAGAPFVARWLRTVPDAPVFIVHHTTEPHRPFRAPPAFEKRFGAVTAATRNRINRDTERHLELLRVDHSRGRPPGATDNSRQQDRVIDKLRAEQTAVSDLYDASVAWADTNLALVVEALKGADVWDDTLFIVLSDHGEELLEHGSIGHNHSLYDELIRVPMLWRFPGGAGGGTRVAAPVNLVDVMPSLLDYLGQAGAGEGDAGASFLPAVRSASTGDARGERVAAVRFNRDLYYRPAVDGRGNINVAVVDGAWKGIWNVETGTFELYDRSNDPGELHDRAAFEPELASRLRAAAQHWLEQRPATNGLQIADDPDAPVAPETVDRLRMLGYLDPVESPGP